MLNNNLPQKLETEIYIYENTKVFSNVFPFPILKPRLHTFLSTKSQNKAPKSPIPKTPKPPPLTKTTKEIESLKS